MPQLSFDEMLQRIFEQSETTKQQGDAFERAVVYFLKNDPLWQGRFSGVWLWDDAPTRTGADVGIDAVARDAEDGSYWAIQCKCYEPEETLAYNDVATFFSTAGADGRYAHFMVADTTAGWSTHLQKVAAAWRDKGTDVVHVDAAALNESALDWAPLVEGRAPGQRAFLEPREHQRAAIEACLAGFEQHDRGKLIMACGTGKTLTALRLAERLCPAGTVLFLAPSINLVAQTLRSWANQSKAPLRPFVVCSDTGASKLEDAWETSVAEVPYPATTDAAELAAQVAGDGSGQQPALTVVFSTYQSIQVVIDAQGLGLGEFDLVVCDEAHRTTGASDLTQDKEEQSAFTKVHDAGALKAAKRLYMTATPRVYSDVAKEKANEESYELFSMDDEAKYGPEFYRLKFGEAVERGLLSDYRVLVLAVSESMASAVYQQTMAARGAEGFDVPEAAKILGCWKGLATRGLRAGEQNLYRFDMGEEDTAFEPADFLPMQRAVAFTSTIKESERFTELFGAVMGAYAESSGYSLPLDVQCEHVDGTMSATERKRKLAWLQEQPGEDICRVLSNAQCLSEGVDVPSLDAVMFMKPKKSQVDIVQAVGRVMRKAPGKEYGYIILPVVVPAGIAPEKALDDNKAFEAVWKVLQALRSHDERLDARINSLQLGKGTGAGRDNPIIVDVMDDKLGDGKQLEFAFDWTVEDWQDAMEVKLVKRCGSRVYWEKWADDVAGIAKRHIERIHAILDADPAAAEAFAGFLTGLRDSLNPGVSEEDAVEMLAQHLITRPVFEALFGGDDFAASNPVSCAMEGMLAILDEHALVKREDGDALEGLYASVRARAAVVTSPEGRQALVKELYEKFFSAAFKATSEKLGIVYTPGEVVDWILHATDEALRGHFGRGLTDEGVHVLDPFAGTGTFMAQLIAGDLISDGDLARKYAGELHSNEIMLLPYYIMTVNVEQAYRARREAAGRVDEGYVPYQGAVLTDTFQMHEAGDTLDIETFVDNSERVLQQMETPIQVIVGNPPYSVGQKSANDDNANESYPTLDGRIRDTYAAGVDTRNKNSLYDSYIRAFRWASDRIGERGVVCFVTNAGWVDSAAAAGMRKCLAEEFAEVRVFHLRGNKEFRRLSRERLAAEGDNIFGSGSKASIAITLLVRDPDTEEQGKIYFHDIGDYLTREEKLVIVRRAARNPETLEWAPVEPDAHGDWLNQRDDSFYEFAPLGISKRKTPLGVFEIWSRGVATARDSWVYSFSVHELKSNMKRHVTQYEHDRSTYAGRADISAKAQDVISIDPTKIKWNRSLFQLCERNEKIGYSDRYVTGAMYRPFCRQWLYYDHKLMDMTYQQPKLFPLVDGCAAPNVAICVDCEGSKPMTCLMVNCLPDLHLVNDIQCFPLHWYEETTTDEHSLFGAGQAGLTRHDAITDEALTTFRAAYPAAFEGRATRKGGPELTKEDLFYYVYGILHSPEYRSRFAANLAKELPRVPLAADFRAFSEAGRKLAELHLNYESVECWPSIEEDGDSRDPGRTEKMRFGKKKDPETGKKVNDRTVLHVAERMTLRNIPEAAYGYVVNGKSAVEWLIDRYQVKTDKASGIVNDCNAYSDDPRYITELVERVVTVSMHTQEIVANLPALNERPQPDDWPAAWKMGA